MAYWPRSTGAEVPSVLREKHLVTSAWAMIKVAKRSIETRDFEVDGQECAEHLSTGFVVVDDLVVWKFWNDNPTLNKLGDVLGESRLEPLLPMPLFVKGLQGSKHDLATFFRNDTDSLQRLKTKYDTNGLNVGDAHFGDLLELGLKGGEGALTERNLFGLRNGNVLLNASRSNFHVYSKEEEGTLLGRPPAFSSLPRLHSHCHKYLLSNCDCM